MSPKEIIYNRHYDEERGYVLRPPDGVDFVASLTYRGNSYAKYNITQFKKSSSFEDKFIKQQCFRTRLNLNIWKKFGNNMSVTIQQSYYHFTSVFHFIPSVRFVGNRYYFRGGNYLKLLLLFSGQGSTLQRK